MKLNKKLIRFSLVATLMLVGFVIANPMMLSAEEDDVDYPTFDLLIDGTADLDTSALENFPILLPDSDFLSLDIGYEIIPDVQVVSDTLTIHKITKVGLNTWRLEFTMVLNAPLINVWDTPAVNNGPSLLISESDISVISEDDAQSERDMGLAFLYGSESALFENDTEDSFTTYNYATDFDLDTYEILFLEDFNSKGTSNVSIVVSYVETTSYVNLNSTYAYNKTIYNEFVPENENAWFRLDLENTNTTFDEYVAHIAISNLDSNGMRSVLSTSANVTDTRYDDVFIGDFDTAISLSSLEPRHVSDYVGDPIDVDGTSFGLNGLELSGFWPSVKVKSILKVPSPLKKLSKNVRNEARGWDTASRLSDSIKRKIMSIDDKVTSIADLDNLRITKAIGSWGLTQKTKTFLSNSMEKAAEVKDSVSDVVEDVKDKSFRTIQFATNMAAEKIEDVKHTADDAKDATLGAFASAKQKASNFGSDVKNKISDTAGKIKDGAISIVGKVKGAFTGGLNKIMMIVGIAIVALIVLFVVFSKMGIMPM